MKTCFTVVVWCLLPSFVVAQLTPAERWRTTVDMGVQMGRVRPDNSMNRYYYGLSSSYYSPYPASYYPMRAAGNRIGLTIHAVHSYIVNRHLSTGLAVGLDFYNNSAFFPLAGAIQGDLSRKDKRITPFYSLESGYAFRGPNPHGSELRGGWLWSPGLGLRINKSNRTGFLISAGYKHQEAQQIASVDGVQTLSQTEYRRYNRLYFRMGFSF